MSTTTQPIKLSLSLSLSLSLTFLIDDNDDPTASPAAAAARTTTAATTTAPMVLLPTIAMMAQLLPLLLHRNAILTITMTTLTATSRAFAFSVIGSSTSRNSKRHHHHHCRRHEDQKILMTLSDQPPWPSAKSSIRGSSVDAGLGADADDGAINDNESKMVTMTTATTTTTVIPDPPRGQKAYPQQPPHSGCHFRSTHPAQQVNPTNGKSRKRRRFFEGWYYRLTLPDTPERISFAFIYSIEDPFQGSNLSLACHQVMGPNDEYLVQGTKDHTKLWAWEHQQGVGCRFDYEHEYDVEDVNDDDLDLRMSEVTAAMDPDEFISPTSSSRVRTGFQFTPHRLQGKLRGQDGPGSVQDFCESVRDNEDAIALIEETCEYDMHIAPITGWGDEEQGQKSTAGWLANYGVFEPHWQVTQSDGRATGYVTWKGKRYDFQNAPFYAEKNWGGSFPIKWFWCQCNSFTVINGQQIDYHTSRGDNKINEATPLSVTAGGGTRKLPLLRSKESLGMVSVHYNGTFYEATPWLGTMEWDVADWGYWKMKGRCTGGKHKFYVELEAVCDAPGVKLRAPTEKDGMVYFCRDSFLADVTLKMWELVRGDDGKEWVVGDLIVEATSSQAAVEIGGGPWWDRWKGTSIMKQPMKSLVRLPYRLVNSVARVATIRQKLKRK